MMKKFFLLTLLSLLLTTTTSCLDNGSQPEMKTTLAYAGYNHVSNTASGENYLKAASYLMTIDFTNLTLDLQINSAHTPEGEPVTMKFDGIKLKFEAKVGYTFNIEMANPSSVSVGNPKDYVIKNMKGNIMSYFLQDQQGSTKEIIVIETGYELNGQYTVFTCSKNPFFPNCETITRGDAEPYVTTAATYEIKMNDTKTADVKINNVKFNKQMPQTTMVLKNVPIKLLPYGYKLEATEITPYVNDVPFESFKVSNFSMTVNNGTKMSLIFNCSIKNVLYEATATGSLYPKMEEKQ